MTRQIIFHGDYFTDFYKELDIKVKQKVQYVLELIMQVDRVPEKFLSPMIGYDGLYEIRIEYQSNIYRVFCCFDEGKLIVLFNGFQKKTQKTPVNEIEKAMRIKKSILNLKNKNMNEYKGIKTFDELIEKEHGKIGTESRNEYEEGAQMFIVSEMLKEARKTANMTQEQLAIKAGTKKSYISKIENAKGNIQLSTLIRIFEKGLNKKVGLTFL